MLGMSKTSRGGEAGCLFRRELGSQEILYVTENHKATDQNKENSTIPPEC